MTAVHLSFQAIDSFPLLYIFRLRGFGNCTIAENFRHKKSHLQKVAFTL